MRLFGIFLAVAVCVAPVSAAEAPAVPKGKIPNAPQIINFGLLEALSAIGHADLAGVFAFIPEEQAPMAMADFLLRNRKALKRFVKKSERDKKKVEAISIWDKHVFMYLTGMVNSGQMPPTMKKVPQRWISRIHALMLAPGLPLQAIVQKREAKK
jgi:hypothetical protein